MIIWLYLFVKWIQLDFVLYYIVKHNTLYIYLFFNALDCNRIYLNLYNRLLSVLSISVCIWKCINTLF